MTLSAHHSNSQPKISLERDFRERGSDTEPSLSLAFSMEEQQQRLMALEALKKASEDVKSSTAGDEGGCNSPSMKALLQLETGSDDLLSGDPNLSTLSNLLSNLKSLASSLRPSGNARDGGGGILRSLLRRRSSGDGKIARVAGSIGSELQSWIDRERTDQLIAALKSPSTDDEERAALLLSLEIRAGQGFDSGFQDVLLQSGAFAAVEAALADPAASKRIRERAAAAVLALVRFNKDVFVGLVLMGSTVRSLVSMASPAALRALNGLIAAIRSPIVDDLHANGEIPRLVALLASSDHEVSVLAFNSALEIGYFGRKDAIDAMLEEGIIKRLMELQRSDLGGALIEIDDGDAIQVGLAGKARPFASCVARFAIQLEVGEGLRQREKRAVKLEVVRRVREAAISGAEAATVLAEVLWGSTP